MSEAAIETHRLGFVYPDGTRALEEVDLRIGQGERVAIIGQNGSGKSTLVRHFDGLLRATEGSVEANGQPIGSRHVAELAVGIAFQNPDRQIFAASVVREVGFGPRNLGIDGDELRVRVDGALAPGVTAKDVVLAIVGTIGTAGGTGYAIEFAGSTIRALSMEGRMTVCNMAIEAGARAGLIAVDQKTIDYVRGRPLAPDELEGLGRIRDGLDGELGATLRTLLGRTEVRATVRRNDRSAATGRSAPAPERRPASRRSSDGRW